MHTQAPNTQTFLPACCLLPVIIMDWTVSIHLCRQVRQSALCKQVVKAKPSSAPRAAHPAAPCLYYALGGEWREPAAEDKLRVLYQDKLTHAHVPTCATQ